MADERKIVLQKGTANDIIKRRKDELCEEKRRQELKKIKDLLLHLAQRVEELEKVA